jgi:hypothetical protein
LVHGVSGALRDGRGRSLEGEDAGGRVGGGGSGVVGMAVEALGAVEALPATEGALAGDGFGINGVISASVACMGELHKVGSRSQGAAAQTKT